MSVECFKINLLACSMWMIVANLRLNVNCCASFLFKSTANDGKTPVQREWPWSSQWLHTFMHESIYHELLQPTKNASSVRGNARVCS